jgi:phytoene dehydrogenase-like protein
LAEFDAVVVGSGPNGLAAAVTLAEAGLAVEVREAARTIGGGTRSEELTLPGFLHDVCSAIHPLAAASPFFARLPLSQHGLELVQPDSPLAHPLDGGRSVVLEQSVEATAARLGEDSDRYSQLLGALVHDWPKLESSLLGPLVHLPQHPLAMTRFGLKAVLPSTSFARRRFTQAEARAVVAGAAAHSIVPLERVATTGYALVLLSLLHRVGWPIARGGSQMIPDALSSYLRSLGGVIGTEAPVTSLAEVSGTPLVMLDLGPRQLLDLAGDGLPARYRRALERFKYGPGVFKIDYALDAPIPWNDPDCARAGTVHLGGTLEEIAASERAPWRGEHAERPFVLLAQPSLFDSSRAPAGKHTVWAYCHVPNGSTFDMTERIEAQIERFANGFRDRVLARSVRPPLELERQNANLVGGDINGGAGNLHQLIVRPAPQLNPYRTPLKGVYLCSASTPPGGGVHGMCGHLAAKAALRHEV